MDELLNEDEIYPETNEKVEGNLIELLTKLKCLKKDVDELEMNLKAKRKEYNGIENLSCRLMRQSEIEKIKIAGIEFTPALPAFKIIGEESEAFNWLSSEGYENAIKQSKPTINHMTLGKIMRERMEEKGLESIPAELFGITNINKLTIKEK